MQLIFNSRASGRMTISAVKGMRGHLGLFFAIMGKMGTAPFLWWSEIIKVVADFELDVIIVQYGTMNSISTSIPFKDFLELSFPLLVEKYMRPFSAALARSWDLPKTAQAIENQVDSKELDRVLFRECRETGENPKHVETALTNILYTDNFVPWHDKNFY